MGVALSLGMENEKVWWLCYRSDTGKPVLVWATKGQAIEPLAVISSARQRFPGDNGPWSMLDPKICKVFEVY